MAEYEVIHEFIDSRTGDRVFPGETTEVNEEEAIRMRMAGVLGRNLTADREKQEQLELERMEKEKREKVLESEKQEKERQEKKKAETEKKKGESENTGGV